MYHNLCDIHYLLKKSTLLVHSSPYKILEYENLYKLLIYHKNVVIFIHESI